MEVRDQHRAHRTVGVLAAVCVVLQLSLAPQISIFGGSVNFMMVLACAVALMGGGGTGAVAGFLAGALYDFTAPVPAGLMMLVLTVMGFVLGFGGRNRLAESLPSSLKLLCAAVLAGTLVYAVGLVLSGSEHDVIVALLGHGLASAVLTALAGSLALALLSGSTAGFSPKHGKGPHLGGIR